MSGIQASQSAPATCTRGDGRPLVPVPCRRGVHHRRAAWFWLNSSPSKRKFDPPFGRCGRIIQRHGHARHILLIQSPSYSIFYHAETSPAASSSLICSALPELGCRRSLLLFRLTSPVGGCWVPDPLIDGRHSFAELLLRHFFASVSLFLTRQTYRKSGASASHDLIWTVVGAICSPDSRRSRSVPTILRLSGYYFTASLPAARVTRCSHEPHRDGHTQAAETQPARRLSQHFSRLKRGIQNSLQTEGREDGSSH